MSTWRRFLVRTGLVRDVGASRATEFYAGTDYAKGSPIPSGYSVAASMSSYARFPWIFAPVQARAGDLSKVPLRLVRGDGADAERIDSHPVLDLLRRPSERVSGQAFRAQILTDLILNGNFYTLRIGARRPTSLIRLHPARTKPIPASDGQADGYEYDAAGKRFRYDWQIVDHGHFPSWEDGPAGLWGQGVIRAMHEYLTAELAAWERQAQAHQQGRPSATISPDGDLNAWSGQQAREVEDSFNRRMKERHGGVIAVQFGMKLEKLDWTASELGTDELHTRVREASLAITGVPPVRMGLESANFATAREQMFGYWQNTLKSDAAIVEAVLTAIAQEWDPEFRIVHDYSDVPYLQEDRTARLGRVQTHWLMGMPKTDAYAYEGFDDAPVEDSDDPVQEEPDPEEDPRGRDPYAALSRWLQTATRDGPPAQDAQGGTAVVDREAERTALWRAWADQLHDPTERVFLRVFEPYFRGQGQRIARRLGEQLRGRALTRNIDDADLAIILGSDEEAQRLREELGPKLREALERAFQLAARRMGEDLIFDPSRTGERDIIANLIAQTSDTTKKAVRKTIDAALTEGVSVNEMQRRIMDMPEFTPQRALRVARTETTRTVNQGAIDAYQEARVAGVDVRVEWLSSRDEHVRPEHRELDGQVVDVGAMFAVPSTGQKAKGPGQFVDAGLSCNCRCTVLPVLPD